MLCAGDVAWILPKLAKSSLPDYSFGNFEANIISARDNPAMEGVMCWSEQTASVVLGERMTTDASYHSDIRLKGNTITHQHMLLSEMQHRMANGLQIVAGILASKAKTVKSDEARLHLLDAYGRVMSLAAVQRQLLESNQSSMVRIDDYLSELSQRLTESLTDKVSVSVIVKGTAMIESNKAVATGLIMSELVINALKHAFSEDRPGRILVTYKTTGSAWILSVSDDGAGLSNKSMDIMQPGYGTAIIASLANELAAHVEIQSGVNGTCVSIIHSAEGTNDSKLSSGVPNALRRERPSV